MFNLQSLKFGVLLILEHKKLNKNNMFSLCQLHDVVHIISIRVWESCLSSFENSMLFTEINNQSDENYMKGKMAGL